MKTIILAGGLSSRVRPLTNDKPKCMLEVNGKTIIQRQIEALKANNLNDVVVVTGYCKEVINYPHLAYIHDDNHNVPSILRGMMCAEAYMDEGFIFSYSDIIYGEDIVKNLLNTKGDIVLTTDVNWQKAYEGRIKHPLTEAELIKAKEGKVIKIGKDVVSIEEAHGEFIGLAKFSPKGVKIIKKIYQDLLNKYKKDQPFQHAKEFQRAYLTDFIQELIDLGYEVMTSIISNIWTEIDTDEDLERARQIWK